MSPEHRAALRTVAQALPAGTPMPITREQLLTLLDLEPPLKASLTTAPLLSVDEVSQRLGVGNQWVYRHARQLGAVKLGRALRFTHHGVQRFIERRSAGRLNAGGR